MVSVYREPDKWGFMSSIFQRAFQSAVQQRQRQEQIEEDRQFQMRMMSMTEMMNRQKMKEGWQEQERRWERDRTYKQM